MASDGEKKWNRPWPMEEMIENAENWSLAGDVALLNILKAFSENLFSKTVGISDNVDNLLHSLDEVNLKLSLSQNEFQSLRNTQFIESRVYEDDETLDFKEEVKPEQKAPSDEEKEKSMRESVLEGLRVMDKYFEKVEMSISDSEDEESDKSYILRPKDVYVDRPLPLVIGTEEWYKKWHVGLADSSSESESEKVSETYSDSESGDDLPKDLIKGSETSSELDFSSQTSENRPVANSTFNDSVKKPSEFASDEESDGQGSVPVKAPISSKSFAEQLAAKLGDVISEREDVSPEINRNPIQKNKLAGDLFSDEPPPLDDLEDTILPKSAQDGLFSGGRGLFDDNEDDLFWGQQNKTPVVKASNGTGDIMKGTVPTGNNVAPSVNPLPKPSQASKGPFDTDSESSDDELFSTKRKPSTKQPFLQPYSTTAPLFDEEPPELGTPKKPIEEKKKPVGGVSIFGKPGIFSGEKAENILKPRQRDQDDTGNVEVKTREKSTSQPVAKPRETVKPKPPNLFDEPVTVPTAASPKPQKISLFDDEEEAKPQPVSKAKKISLFDDDDDLFKDDLFSGIGTNKLSSNLFDDVSGSSENLFSANVRKNDAPKVDLFSDLADVKEVDNKKTEQKGEVKPKKAVNLFSAEVEEEEGLFGVKPTLPSVSEVPRSDIKQETEVSDQSAGAKDEVDKSSKKIVEELPQRQVIGAENLSTEPKVAKGLFDEVPEDGGGEELFKEPEMQQTQYKSNLFEEQYSETAKDWTENPPNVESEPKEVSQPRLSNPKQDTSNATEKSQARSTINLFGSSPPPDDDWDSKSVPSSDEDQFSYPLDYNAAGSSLFDNEPPSLGPNESSGIVRDENVTRVEADESSFNPFACSSRRLSSEVFNEQQSQDSFFVTKSRTESVGVPPSLDRIPETEKSSNLDITPSGILEDLGDSNDSSVFQNSPQQSQTAASKKIISLFDEEFDGNDLFASISKSSNVSKLSDKRLPLFDNIDVLEENIQEEGSKVEEKQEGKGSTKAESVKEADLKSMSPAATAEEEEINSTADNSMSQNDPQQSRIVPSKTTSSLFGEEFDGNDLFSSISKNSNVPKLSDKRLSLFDNVVEEDIQENSKSEDKQEEGKDSAKVESAKENDQKNMSSAADDGKEVEKLPIDSSQFQNSSQPSQTATATSKETTSHFSEEFDGNDLFSSISKSSNVSELSDKKPERDEKQEQKDSAKVESMKEGDQQNTSPSTIADTEEVKKTTTDASVSQDSPRQGQTGTSTSKKTVSLFGEESDGNDLFKSISQNSNVSKLSDKKQEKEEKQEGKDSTKVELTKEKDQQNILPSAVADTKEIKKPPTGSPGKLKHNLKINVNALMPGAAPPKLREMTKSQSLDLPKEQTVTPTQPLSPDVGFFTPPAPLPRKDGSSTGSEKAVSFEDALDNIEVLHSVTKDRAKIPIKRRPSTRRGRRQGIQSATSDSVAAGGGNAGVAVEPPEIKPQVVEPAIMQGSPKENPSVIPPPSEDVQIPPFKMPKTDEQQTRIDKIFDDIGNDDKDLFPASKTVTEEKPKSAIFESEDSDSDLFGHTGLKAEKEAAPKKPVVGKKKPLFNDSSSDEDLFSSTGGSTSKRKENVHKVIEKKPQKSSATRKLENIETDEDPLSSLLR